mmetsp:Transcript_11493/g.34121  ORF Transcript_11493/g.34121 Transcript_11493/m.34121 type:complete len:248 (-) Transcript_11493:1929-2672(-)
MRPPRTRHLPLPRGRTSKRRAPASRDARAAVGSRGVIWMLDSTSRPIMVKHCSTAVSSAAAAVRCAASWARVATPPGGLAADAQSQRSSRREGGHGAAAYLSSLSATALSPPARRMSSASETAGPVKAVEEERLLSRAREMAERLASSGGTPHASSTAVRSAPWLRMTTNDRSASAALARPPPMLTAVAAWGVCAVPCRSGPAEPAPGAPATSRTGNAEHAHAHATCQAPTRGQGPRRRPREAAGGA